MDRLCPDCHKPLHQQTHFGVTLDVCADCAGIWFDAGEMDALRSVSPDTLVAVEQSALPHSRHQPHIVTERWCPACPQPLDRHQYAADLPIALDVCPRCNGVWIPDGELANINACIRQAHKAYRIVGKSPDDLARELAQVTAEHAQFMQRQEGIRSVLTLMQRKPWKRRRFF